MLYSQEYKKHKKDWDKIPFRLERIWLVLSNKFLNILLMLFNVSRHFFRLGLFHKCTPCILTSACLFGALWLHEIMTFHRQTLNTNMSMSAKVTTDIGENHNGSMQTQSTVVSQSWLQNLEWRSISLPAAIDKNTGQFVWQKFRGSLSLCSQRYNRLHEFHRVGKFYVI